MQKILMFTAVAVFSILVGCAHEKEPASGASAAGGGGSLIVGNMASAGMRYMVDQQMTDQDRIRTAQVLESNRPGAASSWVDSKSNIAYTIIPGPTYNTPQGECRNFTAVASVGGNTEQTQGTGCWAANGRWQIVK